MSESKSHRWIRFLRQYGPVAQNDSMYDEHIRRFSKRIVARQLHFKHPIEDILLALFGPDGNAPRSVILTRTASDGKATFAGRAGTPSAARQPPTRGYFRVNANVAHRPEVKVMRMELRAILGNRLILWADSEGTLGAALSEKGAERLLARNTCWRSCRARAHLYMRRFHSLTSLSWKASSGRCRARART